MINIKKQKLKLHYIYYLLAVFDLVTIIFTLNLGYRIHDIYEKSFEMNQSWVERLELLDKLGNTITRLNSPGNDVFFTNNIPKELEKFKNYSEEYRVAYEEVETDLLSKLDNSTLREKFINVNDSVRKLKYEAMLIFSSLRKGKNATAGKHMSRMDVNYFDSTLEISKIRSAVQKIQKEQLLIEHEKAEELFSKEIYVALFIFVIIFVIIYYGHRLKKEFEEQDKVIKDQAEKIHQQAKLSSLGEMAGGIAHEINNPLAIIKGNNYKIMRLLDLNKLDTESLEKIYNVINNTCERMQKTVEGLRILSRDGTNDEMEWVTLDKIIKNAKSCSEMKLISNGVKLINFDSSTFNNYQLYCREIQIAQVFLNLLNNSYDAVSSEQEKWIKLEIEESEGSELRILFTDSGLGIDEEIRSKILEPFFTTKEIGKGTGLGLGISHSIMQDHGGTIELNSRFKNTQFVLTFANVRKHNEVIKEGA